MDESFYTPSNLERFYWKGFVSPRIMQEALKNGWSMHTQPTASYTSIVKWLELVHNIDIQVHESSDLPFNVPLTYTFSIGIGVFGSRKQRERSYYINCLPGEFFSTKEQVVYRAFSFIDLI